MREAIGSFPGAVPRARSSSQRARWGARCKGEMGAARVHHPPASLRMVQPSGRTAGRCAHRGWHVRLVACVSGQTADTELRRAPRSERGSRCKRLRPHDHPPAGGSRGRSDLLSHAARLSRRAPVGDEHCRWMSPGIAAGTPGRYVLCWLLWACAKEYQRWPGALRRGSRGRVTLDRPSAARAAPCAAADNARAHTHAARLACIYDARTHARTHARARARTHTHTHTHCRSRMHARRFAC